MVAWYYGSLVLPKSQIYMTTVIIAICDFLKIPSSQHNYIIELYTYNIALAIYFIKLTKMYAIHFNGF